MTNITPKRPAPTWGHRIKTAWAILKGEPYPQPLGWYDKLYWLVSNEYSSFAERAVDKVNRELPSSVDPYTRRKEAVEWARHYAVDAGKDPDIQPGIANFLVEWWVARKKGRF